MLGDRSGPPDRVAQSHQLKARGDHDFRHGLPSHVLHLSWSGGIGGIERTVEALVERAPGHRVLLLDGSGPIGDALVASGRADRLGMRGGWDLGKLRGLAAVMRRHRPAVVHVRSHALVPLLAARAALPAAAWVYEELSPRVLRGDAKFQLLYAFLRAAQARFVAPSPQVAAAMRAYLPDHEPISVVPVPCAVPIRVGSAALPHQAPVVGVVARIEPQKRVDLLIDVIAELRRGGVDCRALVVGGGSLLATIARRRDQLGLGEIVELAGPRLEVADWLDRMDVFLATSASEPYGVASVEAMARGVPVVAMPCPGGQDGPVGRGGLLLPDREIATAAAAVERLLADESLRQDLRARGARVAAETTTAAVAEQLEAIYSTL